MAYNVSPVNPAPVVQGPGAQELIKALAPPNVGASFNEGNPGSLPPLVQARGMDYGPLSASVKDIGQEMVNNIGINARRQSLIEQGADPATAEALARDPQAYAQSLLAGVPTYSTTPSLVPELDANGKPTGQYLTTQVTTTTQRGSLFGGKPIVTGGNSTTGGGLQPLTPNTMPGAPGAGGVTAAPVQGPVATPSAPSPAPSNGTSTGTGPAANVAVAPPSLPNVPGLPAPLDYPTMPPVMQKQIADARAKFNGANAAAVKDEQDAIEQRFGTYQAGIVAKAQALDAIHYADANPETLGPGAAVADIPYIGASRPAGILKSKVAPIKTSQYYTAIKGLTNSVTGGNSLSRVTQSEIQQIAQKAGSLDTASSPDVFFNTMWNIVDANDAALGIPIDVPSINDIPKPLQGSFYTDVQGYYKSIDKGNYNDQAAFASKYGSSLASQLFTAHSLFNTDVEIPKTNPVAPTPVAPVPAPAASQGQGVPGVSPTPTPAPKKNIFGDNIVPAPTQQAPLQITPQPATPPVSSVPQAQPVTINPPTVPGVPTPPPVVVGPQPNQKLPVIFGQQSYDQLSSGQMYIDGNDGQTKKKP